MVGAGETGYFTLQHMAAAGIHRAYVTNRTERRAGEAAETLGVAAVPFEKRYELLREVDIVISATGESPALRRQSAVLVEALRTAGVAATAVTVRGSSHERIILELSRADKTAGPAILKFLDAK